MAMYSDPEDQNGWEKRAVFRNSKVDKSTHGHRQILSFAWRVEEAQIAVPAKLSQAPTSMVIYLSYAWIIKLVANKRANK